MPYYSKKSQLIFDVCSLNEKDLFEEIMEYSMEFEIYKCPDCNIYYIFIEKEDYDKYAKMVLK